MAYTDEQRAAFLELASEIGITRAMRQLGYPLSWNAGNKWCEAAGIKPALDEIKQQAALAHDWYKTEDLLLVAQQGVRRVYEDLQRTDLTPDEHKKMSEAFQKYANTWRLLQDKATSITENHTKDSFDLELADVLGKEQARNALIEKEVESEA